MNYPEIISYVLAGYEALIRTIPTKKSYSIIHAILKAALFVSQVFDNREKKGAAPVIIAAIFALSLSSCKSIETITCGHTKQVEIVVIKNGNMYSASVPVCDTVIIVEKPKKIKNETN